jgi:hypothetical protein
VAAGIGHEHRQGTQHTDELAPLMRRLKLFAGHPAPVPQQQSPLHSQAKSQLATPVNSLKLKALPGSVPEHTCPQAALQEMRRPRRIAAWQTKAPPRAPALGVDKESKSGRTDTERRDSVMVFLLRLFA